MTVKNRKGFETKLKEVSTQLDQLAAAPNASFDILIRAFKASVLGRNLDLGSSYTTKSLEYAQRILKINKDDAEANLWFGFSLSEGGGQKEAIPYLDKSHQTRCSRSLFIFCKQLYWYGAKEKCDPNLEKL